MPTVPIYRCSKCNREYHPLEAGRQRWECCGIPLQRVARATVPLWRQLSPVSPKPSSHPSVSASSASTASGGPAEPQDLALPVDGRIVQATCNPSSAPQIAQVVEVIPPREHSVDELASELMLGALGNEEPVSLELAADASGIKFLLRAKPGPLESAQHQLQATYTQARFRPVPPDQDPARSEGSPAAMAKLNLRRPCYLPLVTFRDGEFLTADPLRGLLGVLSHLQEGERLLAQLILRPAPRGWADRFASYTRPASPSGAEPLTMGVFLRQFASILVFGAALGFSLCSFFSLVQRNGLLFLQVLPLTVGSVGAFIYLFYVALKRPTIDAELVQIKIRSAAYDVSLRLVAYAPTLDRARQLRRELALAYRQFDRANGNALVARPALFDPQVVEVEPTYWWNEVRGALNRLNVAELAALWHLPLATDAALVEHTQAKRLLPRPATVRDGVLVGESEHMGRKIPVRLEPEALWHHMFMIAKTQKGKSTLMAHLAAQVMRQPERAALVVVDPHGDLARSLLGLVPLDRVSDVVYVDFSDTQRVVGLNLLDTSQGRNADAIVSNIIHVGELIWREYWGPRMEDALRMALRTLLAANEKLVQLGRPQFTLIDIPALYELANFRHRLLKAFVTDPEVVQWWGGYFERLYESLRMDVINPVLTKVHRFSTHSVVRNVIGQSHSTVNFRELLNERKILIVNTATGVVGPDAGGLLGAVIVDSINFAVREQMRIPDARARARVVVIMDEFQSIPGVDYPGLLAELQKMGASFILATQSLGQLDAIDPELRKTIIANAATLFVFQASAEDADLLRHELDDAVTATDIINLPDYACYIKSQREHERLPVMYNQTPFPPTGNPLSVERIVDMMPRYSGSGSRAETARQEFKQEWYGRELDLLLDIIGKGGRRPRSRGEHQDATRAPVREQGTSTSSENPARLPPQSSSSPAPSASSFRPDDQVEPKAKPSQGKEPQGPTRDAREVASGEQQAQPDEEAVADEVERLEEELRHLEEERRRDESSPEGGLAGEDPILDT